MLARALKKGQKIGILGLASPLHEEAVAKGLAYLGSIGYECVTPIEPSSGYGETEFLFSTAHPEARADAFNDLVSDPEVGAIILARGGYSTNQVLEHLDFSNLAENPKPIVGFSDITALLLSVYSAGLVSFHGPMLIGFSEAEVDEEAKLSAGYLFDMLEGGDSAGLGGKEFKLLCGASSEVSGKLLGGNLRSITSLVGTKWQPDFSGSILMLEEIGEPPSKLHSSLLQLSQAGLLDGVKAVVVGDLTRCEHRAGAGPDSDLVLKDIFASSGIPVYTGAPFGHGALNYSFPIGVQAKIVHNKLELSEPSVLV